MRYARRQQYRHLTRSGGAALSAAVIVTVAVSDAQTGGGVLAVIMLLVVAAGLARNARGSWRLAARSGVGADSERAVRHALTKLAAHGWVVRHGVPWPGGGDVDHLVGSPGGLGFAIETKTLTFSEGHLRRTAATARWAARRRRRYPRGVVPVLCVVRAVGVDVRHHDVVVVSLDRLLAVLDRLARRPDDESSKASR